MAEGIPMQSPSHPVLQKLCDLDRSPPGFHDQLSNVLYGEEYVRCVTGLQGDDLRWLIDFLDEVRQRVFLPRLPLKPAQALISLPHFGAAPRKCLRELRSICGIRTILPTSHIISSDLVIEPQPFDAGGFGDVYKGSLGGSQVCVKRVRVYSQHDPTKTAKVRL